MLATIYENYNSCHITGFYAFIFDFTTHSTPKKPKKVETLFEDLSYFSTESILYLYLLAYS